MKFLKGQIVYKTDNNGEVTNKGIIVNIDEKKNTLVIRWEYHLNPRYHNYNRSGPKKKWTSSAGKKYTFEVIKSDITNGYLKLEPKYITHWRSKMDEK